MQKILYFELETAMKDRPKIFRLITLGLLSFSIAIILLVSFTHLSGNERAKQALRLHNDNSYSGVLPTPANQLLHLKK